MPTPLSQAVRPSVLSLAPPGLLTRLAGPALPLAAAGWCVVAVVGQLMFAAYVVLFYGRTAVAGQPELWNKVLPHGWEPGNPMANGVLASHLLFTVFVVLSGALQLLPALRRHAPAVHRWNGRFYVVSAMVLAAGGLVMSFTRQTVGDLSQHIAISLNAVLVLACAGLAWRHALARRFDRHRRWALRLWLAVAGVWFFRIGLMAWLLVNQGPVGFDFKTFTGPFLTVLAFAQYLLPLAVLELYFQAREHAGAPGRLAMAAALLLLTLLTALGSAAAGMMMWLPRI